MTQGSSSAEADRVSLPVLAPAGGNGTARIAVLIPAYCPTDIVVDVVRRVQEMDRSRLIARYVVVDDGSGPQFQSVFDQLATLPDVSVLRHATNLGKGAALKTGINHVLVTCPELHGIVTADADGQHAPENVLAVAAELSARPTRLVLGARAFDPSTPLRSAFGNNLTRAVFRFFTGRALRDTQTGLRGMPVALCRRVLRIPLNGYDFELEALIMSGRQFEIVEIPIRTIYLEGNKSSHFNPVLDSLRIYFVFLRFCGSSLITAVVDNTVFAITLALSGSIGWSQTIARGLAMVLNFVLAREAVFHSHENPRVSFLKFVLLVIVNGFVSYGMIQFMHAQWGLSVIGAKLMAEGALFAANFAIQRELIFTSPGPERSS